MEKDTPVFITGIERSGASIITRILAMSGAEIGRVNNMYENGDLSKLFLNVRNSCKDLEKDADSCFYGNVCNSHFNGCICHDRLDIRGKVDEIRKSQNMGFKTWYFKHSCLSEVWKVVHANYPNAKWIIVRRRPFEIINSCLKTGHMKMFRDRDNEQECWLKRIHKYEDNWKDMIKSDIQYMEIWPDRLVHEDYSQVIKMLNWVGLQWNPAIIKIINPLFENVRK